MEAREENKKVYLQTFGCQMNEYDSEKMLENLGKQNYSSTNNPEQADLIILNTCAIREKAEHKVFSLLGALSEIKASKPEMVIGVGGCVAQQKGAEILARSGSVDLVFGTDNLFELPQLLSEVAQGKRVVSTQRHPWKGNIENFIPSSEPLTDGQLLVKSNIAIIKGCNNYCTFCVVPITRGREVSREVENILEEARALTQRGAKEITLLGQNVNSYRAGNENFVTLLRRLNQLEGLERIRYTSPHPKDFNRELAESHRDLPKLCEHLHLPFQAGSDRILKKMRRNHQISEYMEKIDYIKEMAPGIALSTDIIVGFPGEEENDFQQTLEVMRKIRFDHIYAFKFSPRSETPAEGFENQVPDQVKADRLARLHLLHEKILGEINGNLVGSSQEILLEGPHPRVTGAMIGRTRTNKSTLVENCDRKPGDLIPVEITATRKYSLVAEEIYHESR